MSDGIIDNWDYLIVTASNDVQASGYVTQLEKRKNLGLLKYIDNVLVVADPEGRRVGSGGSTFYCIMNILARELAGRGDIADVEAWQSVLRKLRILIVHAGGDSRRLPAYGPCGKLFVPVPGESDSCLPLTLFDRQLPVYLAMPTMPENTGQVVVAAGDVLLQFDPSEVRFKSDGITGLGCHASPEEASKHGVYVGGAKGQVKNFLQKPSLSVQQSAGAVDRFGQSVLDIGVINFDAATMIEYLKILGVRYDGQDGFVFAGETGEVVNTKELDLYREICCGLGTEASFDNYKASVEQSGSKWSASSLEKLFESSREIGFNFQVLSHCDFLHFGTSRQVISSGNSVIARDRGVVPLLGNVEVNIVLSPESNITGHRYWIEGCKVRSKVSFGGNNLLAGVEIDRAIDLPEGMCLDCLPGVDREGNKVNFIRVYGIFDTFKEKSFDEASFCNMPLAEWMKAVGACESDLWEEKTEVSEMTVFNARLFPAVKNREDYYSWLWMFSPAEADEEHVSQWRRADRYSLAEVAYLTDSNEFFGFRYSIRAEDIRLSLRKIFRLESEFSADDLAELICRGNDKSEWVAVILEEIRRHSDAVVAKGVESFVYMRIMHTLASAVRQICSNGGAEFVAEFGGVAEKLSGETREYLRSVGLEIDNGVTVDGWCDKVKKLVFRSLGIVILSGDKTGRSVPRNSLRKDEIVWGRAPARMDTGGGWTDTPPYSLEYGGSVVNTAIDLNGQPPIHVYARVIDEPVIRISSIDIGAKIEIAEMDQLLDFNKADSSFGLAKAALALCGFSPECGGCSDLVTLEQMLLNFGGGLELTTLAAIPKGSGLGTSSIVGAVLISVLKRVMGQSLTHRQLFNTVLQLEQSLTTGGGWQDQIGGSVPGAKIVSAEAGLVPDPRIHYLPSDVIDPVGNSAQTLLYYTGITRLAKNILEKVVGGYLDRKRNTMATLRQIYACAGRTAEAMSLKDIAMFGKCVDDIWKLNVKLDPDSTNQAVEELMLRIRPYVYGAKLLGAGGGGFIFMVAKSAEDAALIRRMLEKEPPNEKARFFDYRINKAGLEVTVC